MTCEGAPTAVACFDFENAKRLALQLDRLWQYVTEAESQCRESEGNSE